MYLLFYLNDDGSIDEEFGTDTLCTNQGIKDRLDYYHCGKNSEEDQIFKRSKFRVLNFNKKDLYKHL